MRRLAGLLALAATLATQAGPAAAQDRPTPELPSVEARCLTTPTETIEYPEGALRIKQGGLIRVRLKFNHPDRAPDAEVFFSTVDDPLRSLVLERVYRYRVPCLTPGATFIVTQEFAFRPEDGRLVYWSGAREEAMAAKLLDCLTGAERPPSYPKLSLYANEQGSVLIRLTFADADKPPRVDVLFDGGRRRLSQAAIDYASGYRLSCLQPGAEPLRVVQGFRFHIAGEEAALLKDSRLTDLLAGIDGIEKAHLRFDTTTMGCPFDLRFTLRQPVLANLVGELGKTDPNRREFIEWMRTIRLKLSDRTFSQVVNESMTISVPCVVLNLN